MKKDRNCAMPYPAYPPYGMPMNQGMQNPNMGPNMMNAYPNPAGTINPNTIEEQLNNLQGQINMLDKRITRIENALVSPKENLNSSNYHIM